EMTTAETDQFQNQLGPVKPIELSAGRLRYRDHGTGRPVVFLAGLHLHGGFWRKVVPPIREPIRALVPDLPLGAHSVPLRNAADLSPTGLADLIVEFMDALLLEAPVRVASDTGGVLAEIV